MEHIRAVLYYGIVATGIYLWIGDWSIDRQYGVPRQYIISPIVYMSQNSLVRTILLQDDYWYHFYIIVAVWPQNGRPMAMCDIWYSLPWYIVLSCDRYRGIDMFGCLCLLIVDCIYGLLIVYKSPLIHTP